MTIDRRYEIIASPKMAADLHLLRSRAQADPAQHGHLYRETLRENEKLRYGTSDGHHPLGYASGKGDMRDCVTSYVQSGLDRFGRRPASSGGNQAARQAELDARRAIAHAWAGQQPLATSKPLDMTQFGQRGTPAHSPGPTRDPGRER